jgi:hypothetical protein
MPYHSSLSPHELTTMPALNFFHGWASIQSKIQKELNYSIASRHCHAIIFLLDPPPLSTDFVLLLKHS